MTRPLVIAGAGGFARETVELVRAINGVCPTFDLLGYLDDDQGLLGVVRTGSEVLGSLDQVHRRFGDAMVVVCLGSPSRPTLRRSVVARLGLADERFATLVHPATSVAASVRLGVGTVVHAGAVFTADVTVGRHVAVMPGVVLTHDVVVGDHVTFGAAACVAGGVEIGDASYIGSGALIREGLRIGSGSMVGMGSVVTRSIPDGEIWAGNPARRLSIADGTAAGTEGSGEAGDTSRGDQRTKAKERT